MFEYVTDYPKSKQYYTNAADIAARVSLIRERGGRCVREDWVPGQGFCPVYAFSEVLTDVELEVLGLVPWSPSAFEVRE